MRNVATIMFAGYGLHIPHPSVGQVASISAISGRRSSGLVKATSNSVSTKTEGVKGGILPQGKAEIGAPDVAVTIASNLAGSETRNVVPITVLNSGQDSLSNDTLIGQSNAGFTVPSSTLPDAVRSVAATTDPDGLQGSLPRIAPGATSTATPATAIESPSAFQNVAASVALDGAQTQPVVSEASRVVPGTPSNNVSNRLLGQVLSDRFNDVQSPLPNTGQGAVSNMAYGVPSGAISSAVQSAAPLAEPTDAQNPIPKDVLSVISSAVTVAPFQAPSNSQRSAVWSEIAGTPSNGVRNAVQTAGQSAASNEGQVPALKEIPSSAPAEARVVLPKVNGATMPIEFSNTQSVAARNAVQTPLPTAAPIEAQVALPKVNGVTMPLAVSNTASFAARSAIKSPLSSAAPDETQMSAPKQDSNVMPIVTSTTPSTGVPSAVPSPAPSTAPAAAQSTLSKTVPSVPSNTVSNAPPNAPTGAIASAVHIAATSAISIEAQVPLSGAAFSGSSIEGSATPSNVASTGSKIPGARTVNTGIPGWLPRAFLFTQSSGVPSVPLNAELVPHAAMNTSTKGDVVSTSATASRDQAVEPASAPDQKAPVTFFSAGNDIANELAALTQWNSGLHALAQAGVSHVNAAPVAPSSAMEPLNSKDGSKGGPSDVTGLTQHAQPASFHAGSQAGSQEATPSGDQGQGSGPVAGQSATPVQVNSANHTVASIASAQNMAVSMPLVPAPLTARVGGHEVSAPAGATSTPATVPQTLPVINSARLIQSMGQSEMRVGMRTTEFGNISISTSATRDLISAQISLDHGELAKVLTAHLPEMQARLGSNQPVDVRIDMNGQQSRHDSSAFGDSSNGSADASRGGGQQGGNSAPRYSATEGNRQQFSPASAVTAVDGGSDSRLDIRA